MCCVKSALDIPAIWPSILPKIGVVLVEVLPPARCSDLELGLDVGTATLAGLLVSLLVEWQTLQLLLGIVLPFELCLLVNAIGISYNGIDITGILRKHTEWCERKRSSRGRDRGYDVATQSVTE
uniref:Uncharacterized protein n=2 Tax=Glossina palpalis gambiensis TaxID=67801 RepID=A0A1B0BTT2_9MUSC